MLALVDIPRSTTSTAETASLIADYVAFDRQRTSRRPYRTAFGGMAIIVLLGTAFTDVPFGQGVMVAGLLLALPLWLVAVEVIRWQRLVRRLDGERIKVRFGGKS